MFSPGLASSGTRSIDWKLQKGGDADVLPIHHIHMHNKDRCTDVEADKCTDRQMSGDGEADSAGSLHPLSPSHIHNNPRGGTISHHPSGRGFGITARDATLSDLAGVHSRLPDYKPVPAIMDTERNPPHGEGRGQPPLRR